MNDKERVFNEAKCRIASHVGSDDVIEERLARLTRQTISDLRALHKNNPEQCFFNIVGNINKIQERLEEIGISYKESRELIHNPIGLGNIF